MTDSYKLNHWAQYPEECTNVYSYFESRNGAKYPETVFVGLQSILKKYFVGEVVTQDMIEEGELFALAHFGNKERFNRAGWEYIVNKHDGKLPIRIKAVKEGTAVPINNVLMTVEITDENCGWLKGVTNNFETILTHIWFPSNVATIGYNLKKEFIKYLELTDSPLDGLPFMLHDFGYRGTSTQESAEVGGFAHLTQFMGTDTPPAMIHARDYYGANKDFSGIGFSVVATEHSIMTARGEAGEEQVLDQLLDTYDDCFISVVSDSYNIERFTDYIEARKDRILNREGKFIVRPDSLRFRGDTPEDQMLWLTNRMWEIFGGTERNGYKILNPKVGVIWGDGIDAAGIVKILEEVVVVGKFTAEHLAFGMGGGLLQKHDRDTQRNAFKCSAQKQNGEWVDIQKNPLDVTKKSKAGRLKLIKEGEEFMTVREDKYPDLVDRLEVVFENGELVREQTLDEIRAVKN